MSKERVVSIPKAVWGDENEKEFKNGDLKGVAIKQEANQMCMASLNQKKKKKKKEIF